MMGVIDQSSHRFKCHKCGAEDNLTTIQRGSSWGASWGEAKISTVFDIDWNNDQYGEPQPIKIVCSKCGSLACQE